MIAERIERDPDLIAAWVTGVGIGLIVHMITWLIANRITSLVWAPPVGPTIAFGLAIIAGVLGTVIAGRRLAAGLKTAA
jgi:hypothetical protein